MGKRLTAKQSTEIARNIFDKSPVVPVLSVTKVDDAIPLAKALTNGGLNVLEVTLRTKNALTVIQEMSSVKEAVVGVGTIINRQDVKNAVSAGAKFGVSPGITDDLVLACEEYGLPLIGGVSAGSEIMQMLNRGYNFLKFFPAEVAGGISALKALLGPFPQVSFCPTGGISMDNAEAYLNLKNVICVGGSWIATSDMIDKKDWFEITRRAKSSATLGG